MRRLTSILLATLLLAMLSIPVSAEEVSSNDFSVVSAYTLAEEAYVFITVEDSENFPSITLNIDQRSLGTSTPVPMEQTNLEDHYLLLIDLSGSMKDYQNRVHYFVENLLDNEEFLDVTIAGFGDYFTVISEGLSSKEDVLKEVSTLRYSHQYSDILTGVDQSITYFSDSIKNSGAYHLVVVTDGISSYPTTENTDSSNVESLQGKIGSTPEIIVHSVSFNQSSEELDAVISSGKGLNLAAKNWEQAKEAGVRLKEYSSQLLALTYPTNWDAGDARFPITLMYFGGLNEMSHIEVLENVRDYRVAPAIDTPIEETSTTEVIKETEVTTESEVTEETPLPPNSTEEDTSSDDPGEEMQETLKSGEELTDDHEKGLSKDLISWHTIALAFVFFALIVLIIRRAVHYPRKKDVGVPLRLEVLAGEVRNKQNTLYIDNELSIGYSSKCSIRLVGKSTTDIVARIYIKNSFLYIDSLSDDAKIRVGGIRIFEPNLLRSGDEITIGKVIFKLYF